MDHRWRPIQDESAMNSVAGSRMGSEIGGRTTRGGTHRGDRDDTTSRGITQRDSQRTTTTATTRDDSDYFRRPSMRNTGSMSQMSDTSSMAQRPITRTSTGRTTTTNHDTTSRPYTTSRHDSASRHETETRGTRTETTGLSRNQSMTTGTGRHGATVSRNTSMSTTRTMTERVLFSV